MSLPLVIGRYSQSKGGKNLAQKVVTQGLTKVEEEYVIGLLQKVEQPWSAVFFNTIKNLVAMTAIEVVIMRRRWGKIQVLLTQRSPEDAHWPLQYHSPGTMLRANDATPDLSYKLAFRRILKEIGVRKFSKAPTWVTSYPIKTRRGTEHATIFLARIKGKPKRGGFWDLEEALKLLKDVPHGLISDHVYILRSAKKAFVSSLRGR